MNNLTDEQIIKALECLHKRILKSSFSKYVTETEIMGLVNALDLINRQKAEIERYQKEHQDFCKRLGSLHSMEIMVMERTDEIKSEAIKEFAERLKEKASRGFWNELAFVDVDDIDNLVEEMVGE